MLFFPIFQAGMYYIILMDISSTKLYFLTVAFYSLTLIIIFCKYQHFFPSTGMGKPLYWYGKMKTVSSIAPVFIHFGSHK